MQGVPPDTGLVVKAWLPKSGERAGKVADPFIQPKDFYLT